MRMLRNREGFALPMTILVIGFMTAGVLAAFARSGTEAKLVDNDRAQLTAFAVAEAGLQQYIATMRGMPDTMATSTYIFSGDTARVTAKLIKPAPTVNDAAIWLIRSESRIRSGTRGDLRTTRTVAQLAYRRTGTMQVLSTWTSLSGLSKQGQSGVITGDDACTTDVKPGVAVPTGTFSYSGQGSPPVSGDPPIDQRGTQAQMAAEIKIDWAGITDPANPSITPDIIVCKPGTPGYIAGWGPCGAFPTTFPTGYWPTIVINGTSPLPTNGRGTLIVTGDLTFGGQDQWNGIIMVGGAITDNGSGNIEGAVVSGLNVLKNMPVGQSSKLNGVKDYTYNSCDVAAAAANQSRLVALQNAWVDNYTSY